MNTMTFTNEETLQKFLKEIAVKKNEIMMLLFREAGVAYVQFWDRAN